MKLLAEIFHHEGLNISGKAVIRNAVRTIIFDQDKFSEMPRWINKGNYCLGKLKKQKLHSPKN